MHARNNVRVINVFCMWWCECNFVDVFTIVFLDFLSLCVCSKAKGRLPSLLRQTFTATKEKNWSFGRVSRLWDCKMGLGEGSWVFRRCKVDLMPANNEVPPSFFFLAAKVNCRCKVNVCSSKFLFEAVNVHFAAIEFCSFNPRIIAVTANATRRSTHSASHQPVALR